MINLQKKGVKLCVSPWLIFVVSFAVTLWLWHSARQDNLNICKARFQNRVSLAKVRIHDGLRAVETALWSCERLFTDGHEVSRDEWHRSVSHLWKKFTFPNILGFGFAQRVSSAELPSHIQNVRAEGVASYTIKPEGERTEYFPIVYLEPFEKRNKRAFGYDMFSEPTRRAAMEQARDQAIPIISGKVDLLQEIPGENVQAGFLMYFPTYSKNTSSLTINERRQMLTGFVYAPIRFGDFMDSLILTEPNWVGVNIYDGDEIDSALLVYEARTDPRSGKLTTDYVPSFETVEKLSVCGHTWTVKFFTMPSFDRFSDTSTPLYILILGFLISCLLTEIFRIMRSRNQAFQVVEKMKNDLEIRVQEQTENLRKSNRLLRMLSDWNKALIRAESETQLLETMTDLLIKSGGYQCCLVGYSGNDAGQSIRLVAHRGFEEEHLKIIKINDLSWAAAGEAARPLGMAIKSGQPVIVNDVCSEAAGSIWRKISQNLDIVSLAAIPLISADQTIGVVCIFSAHSNAFASNEMVILEEMAMDLAFGIETQRSHQEHLRAEEELARSEKNLRSAQALAHIGNWTLNPVTGDVWWSKEIHRIFGHDPALSPPTFQELQTIFMTASWERLQAAIDQTLKSGTPYDLELEYRCEDGKTGWARTLGQAMHNSQGEVVELHGTLQDITKQKQMEAELLAHQENLEKLVAERTGLLKESEERYRIVIKRTGQIVYELDVLNRRTTLSGAAEELLGFSPDEFNISFEQWLANVHPDDQERVRPLLVEATKVPGAFSYEYRYLHKDEGFRFILDRSISLADSEGQVSRVIGTMADITAQKQFEEALEHKNVELQEAKETADRANRAKSEFLANMSHEIRTPMNAILGFSQLLANDSSLKPKQADEVQTIIRSGNHLLALIDDILDVSKIEAGQASLNLSTFSLRQLVADLKMMFNSRAAGKGLQFLTECDENLPTYVLADENKLRQILINLLGNAFKFTSNGGISVRLRFDTDEDKPWTGRGPFCLVGEVEDSGPGIADEDVPKIFNTFKQAGAGLKEGGTGLGLAISRGFARLMAGDITFTSQPGKGSCFRFHVLLEAVEAAAENEKPAAKQVVGLKPGTAPTRVLVVDDIPENRELIVKWLCPVGFEVHEAANGIEALDIFQAWSPDIVLMDMRMPGMDGYEAIRRLRTTEAGRQVPILSVTASVFDESQKQVMKAGANAFLRKPFKPEELFAEIGKLLNLHYIFADEPAGKHTRSQPALIKPAALSALSPDLLKKMQQAVTDGDIVGLLALIEQVAETDSDTASGLQELARLFEYEKLARLLAKAKEIQ